MTFGEGEFSNGGGAHFNKVAPAVVRSIAELLKPVKQKNEERKARKRS